MNGPKDPLPRPRWRACGLGRLSTLQVSVFFFLLVHILDTAVCDHLRLYNGVLRAHGNPMGLGEDRALSRHRLPRVSGHSHLSSLELSGVGNNCTWSTSGEEQDGNVEISQKATYTHTKILWVHCFSFGQLPLLASPHVTCRSFFSHVGGH